MGLLKAGAGALGGVLADSWRDYFYCESLDADVLQDIFFRKTGNFLLFLEEAHKTAYLSGQINAHAVQEAKHVRQKFIGNTVVDELVGKFTGISGVLQNFYAGRQIQLA